MTDGASRGLGEELRLLVTNLAERAQPWLHRLASDPRPGQRPAAEHDQPDHERPDHERPDHAASGCTWCPVCAGLALARGERPELTARAAEHVAGLLSVLRAAMTEPHPTPPQSRSPEPDRPATSEPSTPDWSTSDSAGAAEDEPPRPPRVQHIPVRRAASGTGPSPAGQSTAGPSTAGPNREPLC